MPWSATHRFARISARKARLMADLIRGRDVQDALNILKFTPNRAASLLAKVLTSAVANANEAEADVEILYVQEARVDEGPTIRTSRYSTCRKPAWTRARRSSVGGQATAGECDRS
jgi:large subunit ribosomal protein L22